MTHAPGWVTRKNVAIMQVAGSSATDRKAQYAQIRKERALANVSGYATSFEQTPPTLPDRPARIQIEQRRKLQQAEHIGEYNIWYNRYQGENNFERAPRASTRVVVETDAGLTQADYTNPNAHICLHFARGDCTQGKACAYRHCLPTEEDETQSDAPHDVFGRNRHGRCASATHSGQLTGSRFAHLHVRRRRG